LDEISNRVYKLWYFLLVHKIGLGVGVAGRLTLDSNTTNALIPTKTSLRNTRQVTDEFRKLIGMKNMPYAHIQFIL
jgi:hypothetical protein